MDRRRFIQLIAPLAKNDYYETLILPSLTIAQAILESRSGESYLTVAGNNLFGIKGKPGAQYWTKEWDGEKMIDVLAWFRHYDSWADSIRDHSNLFHRASRYKKLIGERVYTKACIEVQRAGYATDPSYADKLVQLIEEYHLYQYDMEVFKVEVEVKQLRARVEKLEKQLEKIDAPKWFRDEFPGLAELVHEPMELIGWRAAAVALREQESREQFS